MNRFNLHLNKKIDCKQSLFCSEISVKNTKSKYNSRVCCSQLADRARFFCVTDSRVKDTRVVRESKLVNFSIARLVTEPTYFTCNC